MTATAATTTTTTETAPTSRLRVAALSLLVAVAGLLGLATVNAGQAQAATTRSITACISDHSLWHFGHVAAQWKDGTGNWVLDTQAPLTTGCGTVYMHHSGNYRLRFNSAIQYPCITYWFLGATGAFVQQNQPISQRATWNSIPANGNSGYYC